MIAPCRRARIRPRLPPARAGVRVRSRARYRGYELNGEAEVEMKGETEWLENPVMNGDPARGRGEVEENGTLELPVDGGEFSTTRPGG